MISFPSIAAGAQLPPLDEQHLAELRVTLGTGRVAELLSLLTDQLEERTSAIDRCKQDNKLHRLRSEAHNLGGMVSCFGLQRVAIAAWALEVLPQGRELDDAMERLQSEVELALICLRRSLSKHRVSQRS